MHEPQNAGRRARCVARAWSQPNPQPEVSTVGKADPALQRQLVEANQVFTLDIDQLALTDEAWEMCDFIEHYLAVRCDGLIYAPVDGIFDAKLQPLAKTRAG